MDVQGRVPGGGDQDGGFLAVDDGFDAGVVGGEDALLAGCQVDSMRGVRMLDSSRLLEAIRSVERTYFLTSQSSPTLKASSSFSPKHTSSTGARCSNVFSNCPPGTEVS